jgi:hypothetical protein
MGGGISLSGTVRRRMCCPFVSDGGEGEMYVKDGWGVSGEVGDTSGFRDGGARRVCECKVVSGDIQRKC